MNRIDRLHAILTHLQSKKKVTAQEMADRFNISLRTVYRDVKSLDESGVPVIGEAGTGYTIIKIKAVLRSPDKEYVDKLTEHVEILSRYSPDFDSPSQHLSLLQQAVVHKKIVQLRYRSNLKEEVTMRKVEPIGLVHYGSAWHLVAWCHLRNDYRDFRMSRMLSVTLEEAFFDPSSHPSIREYIDKLRQTSELEEVIVQIDKTTAKYLQEQKYLHGFVSEEELETCFRMKFLTSSLRYFSLWLLMYTDKITIESPAALKVRMTELVERLFTHYKPNLR
jgi:predicted DNA-binding transcriptional regulator YafY